MSAINKTITNSGKIRLSIDDDNRYAYKSIKLIYLRNIYILLETVIKVSS